MWHVVHFPDWLTERVLAGRLMAKAKNNAVTNSSSTLCASTWSCKLDQQPKFKLQPYKPLQSEQALNWGVCVLGDQARGSSASPVTLWISTFGRHPQHHAQLWNPALWVPATDRSTARVWCGAGWASVSNRHWGACWAHILTVASCLYLSKIRKTWNGTTGLLKTILKDEFCCNHVRVWAVKYGHIWYIYSVTLLS